MLGYGDAISYDQLVQRITGDSLDKSHRFTDWTRRPLSEAQLAYAISDVTHLRDVYLKLSADLDRRGEAMPDLVIADHGWAGAAGEAGVETVGFADSNDPGLFVGEAEEKIAVTVPLDDNVLPRYYRPLTAYLIDCVLRDL